MKAITRSLLRHAHAIAREVGARAVLLSADVAEPDQDVVDLLRDVDFRTVMFSRRGFTSPEGWGDLCSTVILPDIPLTRAGQIKAAVLVASAEGLIVRGDRVVCMTGLEQSGALDTILVLDLGAESELLAGAASEPLPPDVTPAVFERLLSLAAELGLEGREGRAVGALFVVGDTEAVLSQSRQLVINPFQGYPESERNVLDPRLEETIKEFSAIDGAFIVRGDGLLVSAGRYLAPLGKAEEPLPRGLGARHEAAASITATTAALALSVSQSTGTVSLFKLGRLVADLQKPRSHQADAL